ncbi:MAG: hypothetical protein ACLFS8_07085 [Clostridia bacterium]
MNTHGSPDEEEELPEDEMRQGIVEQPGYGHTRLKPKLDQRMASRINHRIILELPEQTNPGFARQVAKDRLSPMAELQETIPMMGIP